MHACRNVAAQAFLIAKYWAFTDTFNKSNAPLWFKQLFIFIGKLFPSSSVDAYYLAYAVPGDPPLTMPLTLCIPCQ